MKALFKTPQQLEYVRVYKIFCTKCGKIVLSNADESRWDFMQRLLSDGWSLHCDDIYSKPVICPDCKNHIK